MSYNIQEHGDFLEKQATTLIRNDFPHYESVWSVYIGNKGNDTIATLPKYRDETKRKHFAENSYTVLESFFLIHHILKSKIFEQSITKFDDYIEFNKAFITFFALLGRIRDTAIKASENLGYDNTVFKESIRKFYEARSIVVHGKKVPLMFDELGLLKIPFLKTNIIPGNAWDDKHSLWGDVMEMRIEYAADKLTSFFDQLIHLINNEYATFHNLILQELKAIPTSIKFEYNSIYNKMPVNSFNASGVTGSEAIDVYNFKGKSPTTNL